MIVADSTYIVDALLVGDARLGTDRIITPSLAMYEVANAIFVREKILRLTGTGQRYLAALFRAIETSLVELVDSSESLMKEAYEMAVRNQAAVYDCVFVALSLESGLPLETRDSGQLKILERERMRQTGSPAGSSHEP